MSKHDDDTCPHLVRASLLEAENARLKTEVQHLMIFCNSTLIPSKELQEEIARLKAECERLRKAGDALHKSMLEVGPNEMAEEFDHDRWWASYYGWQAAKESKPSV